MKRTFILLAFFQFIVISAFSQWMDAGTDTVVCPGNPIQLDSWADTTKYLYVRWEPEELVSDPHVVSPYAYPDGTTTYYFYAYKPDTVNKVSNGDFQSGNMGFTSQYRYVAPGYNALWPESVYTVVYDASTCHDNFPQQQYDHTYGTTNGRYMAINGAGTPNTIVWSQTATVKPNTDYVFSAWAASITNEAPAELQFNINGVLLGTPFILPGIRQSPWLQFYTIWNSGSSTSVVITIVNQVVATSGNDFALDDIFFAEVIADIDSVTIWKGPADSTRTIIEMCADKSYVFNKKYIITESGEYIDTLKNQSGCDSITYLEITFMPQMEVDLGEDQTWCKADTQYVILTPGMDYHHFLWNTGDTLPLLYVQESGTYTITVYDKIGCEATAQVNITFVEPPIIEITSDTEDFCEKYSMTLSIETEAPEILWSNGETGLSIEATEFGIYTVEVSNYYCFGQDTFEIEFCCPKDPKLPNVITPSDHNEINDNFGFPPGLPYTEMEIYIYNRWGKKVVHSSDVDFRWDGTVNGKLEKGVYYYVITLKDGCTFHGSITVF